MPVKRYQRGSHPYHNYHHRRFTPRRKRKWPYIFVIGLVAGAVIIAGILYERPLPSVVAAVEPIHSIAVKTPQIQWPDGSQAAFGTLEQGLLTSSDHQTPRPTASTAKVITALAVLKKKPLQKGEQGPTITLTQADVDIYNSYFVKDGSVVPVSIGEKLTEYQMLQGILIPSANNYADTLAVWAFGSLDDYQKEANKLVKSLGMHRTVVGEDASGFSPTTVSTAEDLTKLGIEAMKHPLITDIAGQDQVELPIAGVKQSTNWLLGSEEVNGVKTGNTNEAGGVYIFSAKHAVDPQHNTTIVGVVQGKTTLFESVIAARTLLREIKPQFTVSSPVKKGQQLAKYRAPWGAEVSAQAERDISYAYWVGKPMNIEVRASNASSGLPAGSVVGLIKVGEQSTQLVLAKQLSPPDMQWRLWRPGSS